MPPIFRKWRPIKWKEFLKQKHEVDSPFPAKLHFHFFDFYVYGLQKRRNIRNILLGITLWIKLYRLLVFSAEQKIGMFNATSPVTFTHHLDCQLCANNCLMRNYILFVSPKETVLDDSKTVFLCTVLVIRRLNICV